MEKSLQSVTIDVKLVKTKLNFYAIPSEFRSCPRSILNEVSGFPIAVRPQLSICSFIPSPSAAKSLAESLDDRRYSIHCFEEARAFLDFVEDKNHQIDCFLLEHNEALASLTQQLCRQSIILPAIIMQSTADDDFSPQSNRSDETETDGAVNTSPVYHSAEIQIPSDRLDRISTYIDRALSQFLKLAPITCTIDNQLDSNPSDDSSDRPFLLPQQQRLAEKLKERLGYLGVYYKRHPKLYLRNLPPPERQQYLEDLKERYREIILSYFSDRSDLNQQIDEFVNLAFFADISVTRIVEIHMELMDEFAKQLKLEGRNEEIVIDYRLTLIDTISHLCEMYRRSIPRET